MQGFCVQAWEFIIVVCGEGIKLTVIVKQWIMGVTGKVNPSIHSRIFSIFEMFD
jgi:hypothetical protein